MAQKVRLQSALAVGVVLLVGSWGLWAALSPAASSLNSAPSAALSVAPVTGDRADDRAFFEEADRSRLLISDRARALVLQARRAHELFLAAQERDRAAAFASAARRRSTLAVARRDAAARQRARKAVLARPVQRAAAPTDSGDGAGGGGYASAQAWASSVRASRVRDCESGDNYAEDTGNGYYGAYQFSESTWRAVGGRGYPQQSSPREQDYRAYLLWQRSGWSAWGCA